MVSSSGIKVGSPILNGPTFLFSIQVFSWKSLTFTVDLSISFVGELNGKGGFLVCTSPIIPNDPPL